MKLIKHLSIALIAAATVSASHAQEGADIKARFKELEAQARAAKEAGRHDEAQAIMEKAKRMIAEKRDGEQGGDKLEMAKRKIEELRKAGKNEEADQLERRVREAGEKRRDREKEKPAGKVRDGERGGDERMEHIEQAVKHLRAAGLHEPAERILQMARGQQNPQEHRPNPDGDAQQDQLRRALRETQEQTHRALRDTQAQTERALRETHEQMAKMARAIEELREQVAKGRKERD